MSLWASLFGFPLNLLPYGCSCSLVQLPLPNFSGFNFDPPSNGRIKSLNGKPWQALNALQETNRMSMDAKASERTGMELYFAPFQGAVAAGVGAFMCAYNKAGQPSHEEHELGMVSAINGACLRLTVRNMTVFARSCGFADLRRVWRGNVVWMLRCRWL